MSGAGRPVRSVNARIDVGQTVEGKKCYVEKYPLTTNQVISAEEIDARLKSSGKKRFKVDTPTIKASLGEQEPIKQNKESIYQNSTI